LRVSEAVGPADVGHQVAGRAPIDQIAKLEAGVVVLAGRHRDVDAGRHLRAGREIVGQHRLLVPDEIEVGEQTRLSDVAEHVELLVDVHHQADVVTHRLLHTASTRARFARGSGWWIFILKGFEDSSGETLDT
jgi:hypothetical protein